jgi:CRISPR system Cascade subunit CasA
VTFDLLHEPLIQTDQGWHSLPGLLAALSRGEVASYPALRPHQRPAWHMFLVQLAVLALDEAGRRDLPVVEEDWRQALRGLTTAFPGDEPWLLVGADRGLPAFMQPPDPGELKWSEVETPDALDMLITSRNHDLKRSIARNAAPQDWIFALVSLQTMEGFGGAGNYGIARMNGGSSSRVLLGLAPARAGSADVDPSAWWARDVARLLIGRAGLSGKALIWLEPWPEGGSLGLEDLDRLFIEVCRRIRLVSQDGRVAALRSTSKAARIAGKDAKGNTGDPWAPVHIAEGKSLTLGERDWTHELLVDLLFRKEPKWHKPPLARDHANEATEPMLLVAEALSRGNSKTDGFKSRIVPVPKAVLQEMFGERSVSVTEGILEDIAAITKCLTRSLRLVGCSGDEEKLAGVLKSQSARTKLDKYAESALSTLRRQADEWFFPELWVRLQAQVDADFQPLRLAFLERLAGAARAEFRAALPGIPCASLMRPRAEVRGWQALDRGLFFTMKDVKLQEGADD